MLGVTSTYAQAPVRPGRNGFPAGSIEGRVLDDKQTPVAGAMVSVVGRATAVATTDRDGRFALRELPFGPYVLSVHSRGYWQSRGRTIQLTNQKVSVPEIQLARVTADRAPSMPAITASVVANTASVAPTQLAGFGVETPAAAPAAEATPPSDDNQDKNENEGETAWRLRHLPRSILKDAAAGAIWTEKRPDFGAGNWSATSPRQAW